ncbi:MULTISPECIES: hypothetical protein [Mesorhizobium]|uniref:hypothetical protein n=1 Tax=Mesorhizobium TaxID=68287 RepID=UPI0025C1D927|nr:MULTISPECIES: hypothetical protein [unclassified Mesorhizobium]MDX8449408.1 hypothetical protein [Mesorhizobium sp. VK3C]
MEGKHPVALMHELGISIEYSRIEPLTAMPLTQINARPPHPDEGKNKALAPVFLSG